MAGGESQTQVTLSDRELQVIELVSAGLTNEHIAEELEISKRTVDNHISNILKKTKANNRVALVRWALQSGKVCINDVNCCALPPYKSIEEEEDKEEPIDEYAEEAQEAQEAEDLEELE